MPPVARRPSSLRVPSDAARAAVAELFAAHGDRLYASAIRLCGRSEEAEDLVQETLLAALRGWDGFAGRSEPTTWLYAIAKHACFRRRRRRAGEPAHLESIGAESDLLPSPDEPLPDPDELADPARAAARGEATARVERGLAELPFGYRLPLVLVDIAELSIAETATVLGLKEATVKTRVHRARLRLRQALAAGARARPLAADHPRTVCLDLLRAKQEALDRGTPFPYSEAALCDRCRSLLATLDLGHESCRLLGRSSLPERLRALLDAELAGPRPA